MKQLYKTYGPSPSRSVVPATVAFVLLALSVGAQFPIRELQVFAASNYGISLNRTTANSWGSPYTASVDGDIATGSYLTYSGNELEAIAALDLTTPGRLTHFKVSKFSADTDANGGTDRMRLEILYTTDMSPLNQRVYRRVTGMQNGVGGAEPIAAETVQSDGVIVGDTHSPAHGTWWSVSFDPIYATGIALRFHKLSGSGGSFVHYPVNEFQVYGDTNAVHDVSVVSPHGVCLPPAGVASFPHGSNITFWVSGFESMGTTQYVCTGWTGTGSVPLTGGTTNVSFSITNDSSIVWNWATNHWLAVDSVGNGGVDTADGWFAAGSNVTVMASPAENWHFVGWIGDTDGCVAAGNTLTAPMTQARTVTASFVHPIFVDASRPNDTGDGRSWATAKKTLQAAINLSVAGDTVVVTNGVYAPISTDNKAITIQSVNGAAVTVIDGGGGQRCASLGYATTNTVISGFTLQNGLSDSGGGAHGGTLNDCVLRNNTAYVLSSRHDHYSLATGGGATDSVLNNCLLQGNSAHFVAQIDLSSLFLDFPTIVTVSGAAVGGGAYECVLNHCRLERNEVLSVVNVSGWHPLVDETASFVSACGGGSFGGTLSNCIVANNNVTSESNTDHSWGDIAGGGCYWGTQTDCTITHNQAIEFHYGLNDNGGQGGGVAAAVLTRCGIYNNRAQYGGGSSSSQLTDCTIGNNRAGFEYLCGGDGGGTIWSTLNSCRIEGNVAVEFGGGAYGGELYNSTLVGNTAEQDGGGVYEAVLYNCVLRGNAAYSGGGSYNGVLVNCTLSGNSAFYGAGSSYGTLNNCIVRGNIHDDCYYSAASHSCIGDHPFSGVNNIFEDPLFLSPSSGVFLLREGSPCVDAGSNAHVFGSVDLLGNPRIQGATVDMGAYEGTTNGCVVIGSVQGFGRIIEPFAVVPPGGAATFRAVADRGRAFLHFLTNGVFASSSTVFEWSNITSDCEITAVFGQLHVDASMPDDNGDGATWQTAKKSIQSAIDISEAGDVIHVARGTYGPISTADKSIHIRSVDGATVTVIDGGGTQRCAWLGDSNTNSVLTGFALRNGRASDGGGSHYGTLNECVLSGNRGGKGGGSCYGTLNNCTLTGNTASYGGGSYGGMLNNCTLTGNSASSAGGGSSYGTLNNCVVYYNTSPVYPNCFLGTIRYSCTMSAATGNGNITNAPLFVATNDFRLAAGSPCINAGNNAYVQRTTDLDGMPRIVGGTVDMGAYERVADGTSFTVTFDPEGGEVSPATVTVNLGAAYGSLATPTRAGLRFAGWWTGNNGTGTEVTEVTLVTTAANHTLYAKWTVNPTATVANVAAAQVPGTKQVLITYDVSSDVTNLVAVSVVVSNASGVVSESHFSGHVGPGVPVGTGRQIVWDGGADQDGQNLTGLQVWMDASAGEGGPTSVPPGMTLIPAGSFTMGDGFAEGDLNERPTRDVAVSGFYMDKHEVTKSLWSDSDDIQHARANYNSTTAFPYDTSLTRGAHPTYSDGVMPYTSPVGTFAANGYGLHDAAGNVWEWCWDWHAPAYYATAPSSDPRGPASGSERASRGAGWGDIAVSCRLASRNSLTPDYSYINLGFRPVRRVP